MLSSIFVKNSSNRRDVNSKSSNSIMKSSYSNTKKKEHSIFFINLTFKKSDPDVYNLIGDLSNFHSYAVISALVCEKMEKIMKKIEINI